LPVLLAGLWPWTPAVPAAIAGGWKAPRAEGFRLDRFLVVWAGVIVVFFSASHSKLPGYILPALPAIVLLFARQYPALSERARRAPALAAVVSGAVLAVVAAGLLVVNEHLPWKATEAEYSVWLLGAAIALSAAGFAALELRRRAQQEASLAVVALGSLLAAQLALSGTHLVDEHYSAERLIEPIVGDALRFPRDAPFYSVKSYDQSVPFYLGRSVTLVGYKDELAPGIAAEPGKYVGSVDEFLGRWREHDEAFAIMSPRLYEELKVEGLPGTVLARDSRWIIVARR
jgi:4-amino-4-deoxy-L-arabinose transferase-like glycosyltransferase